MGFINLFIVKKVRNRLGGVGWFALEKCNGFYYLRSIREMDLTTGTRKS